MLQFVLETLLTDEFVVFPIVQHIGFNIETISNISYLIIKFRKTLYQFCNAVIIKSLGAAVSTRTANP